MKTRRNIRQMISVVGLASALGLTALASAGSNAKNVHTSVLVPLQESVFNPATGETMNFVGNVNFNVNSKTMGDGSVRISIQDNALIPGAGDKSGNTYIGKIHDQSRFGFSAAGFPLTVTLTCDMHVLNAGSCNDIEVPMTVELTIQKDGSVTAKYVEDDGGGDVTP